MRVLIMLILPILISCYQEKVITNKSIGVYKLHKELTDKGFDKSTIETELNQDNMISSITIMSSEYKTEEGFGVGSTFEDIKKGKKKWIVEETGMRKGSIQIGKSGSVLIYDGIDFFDINKNGVVDFISIDNY